ncbi:MAG: tRNA (adenosine(37)-N6)-threonylcarbamoyltransferase complex transferase subunit TsaD [bacterium]
MKILGIETSCDETSAAIVLNGNRVLSNVVSSSIDLHKKTGGVVPEIAARKQLESILPVLEECAFKAKTPLEKVDAIAVTTHPGLIGSLIVGVATAKTLALVLNKPLIPVNHLLAHIYANWIYENPPFPTIALIVSGGHTELVLMKNHKNIVYLGGTRDDASGESFDKIARILGLEYPGGPAIDKKAQEFDSKKVTLILPKPLINSKDYDFSFSGLKTATFSAIKQKKYTASEIAFSFQEAVGTVLVKKTVNAALEHTAKSIVVAGGVSANKRLRELFFQNDILKNANIPVYFPKMEFCTDNAAIIAACAYFHNKAVDIEKVKPNSSSSFYTKTI